MSVPASQPAPDALAAEGGEAVEGPIGTVETDEAAEGPDRAVGDPVQGDSGRAEQPVDLDTLIAERDAYLTDLQRVTAEFANFRRQTAKRNDELVAQAASRLAKELLVVLDACEAAVNQGVEGIEALQSQLVGVLSDQGLAVLGTAGEAFDPSFHEAVMSEESADGEANAGPVVAEVLRTGYAWKGRVLRPAMVKVRG